MLNKFGPLPDEEDCKNCPLAVDGKPNQPVRGYGPENPRFIVVGESSGAQERRAGVPFVGPSGKLLDKSLGATGVKREDIYCTNSVLCDPPFENKDKILPKAVECCSKRLRNELIQIGKKPVLATGTFASKALLGSKFKITELAGTLNEFELNDQKWFVIPTLHPAFILRGAGKKGKAEGGAHSPDLGIWNLIHDIDKVKRLSDGHLPEPINFRIEGKSVAKTRRLVNAILDIAEETKIFGLDLETVGRNGRSALEPVFADITVLGLAIPNYLACSVVWEKIPWRTKKRFGEILQRKDVTKIIHNRIYDQTVLECNGFPMVEPIICTMLMHHNAFPGLAHRLQRVVSQMCFVRPWKAEFAKSKESLEDLQIYNAQDTGGMVNAYPKLAIHVKNAKAEKTLEIDLKKAQISKEMTIRGIPIDVDTNRKMGEFFKTNLEEARDKLKDRIKDEGFKADFINFLATEKALAKRKADPDAFDERRRVRKSEILDEWDGINFDAGPHVAAYLKACGIYLENKTKTGKTRVNKDDLENLATLHDEALELQRYRFATKMYSTFIEGVHEKIDANNFLHPVWSVNKISGRWGSSPNCQNWSEGDVPPGIKTFDDWWQIKQGQPNLRWQVRAKPGRIIIAADASALEARIVAQLSGDEWLCDALINNVDTHSIFAGEIFPVFNSLDKKSPERHHLRNLMKRFFYGYVYGASTKRVWTEMTKEGIKISMFEVQRAFDFLARRLPKIAQFQYRLIKETFTNRHVKSMIYGRKRYYPLGQGDEGEIKNFICQSSGADIADTALIKLHEKLPHDAYIFIQVHDAIYADFPEHLEEEGKRLFTECLTQEYTINGQRMIYPWDVKSAKSWGEL